MMNKTLKNLVRKLGVVVCLCMVCLLLTVPACASEDWNALNISITYEYQGETVTVNATPVAWSEDQAFWAYIPQEAWPSVQISVMHPYHENLSYTCQLDMYGQLTLMDAGTVMAPENACTIVATDESGQMLDMFRLYLSTQSEYPEQTPAGPEVSAASAQVSAQWVADGEVLYQETQTVSADAPHTFYRNAFPGYEPDADCPESVTIVLQPDGRPSMDTVVFTYHAAAVPVTVTYRADDGTVLHEQTLTLQPGTSQEVPRLSFPGYVPVDGMPESLTVSVDASGVVSPDAPGFLYTLSQTQVTVRHVAEDGTELYVGLNLLLCKHILTETVHPVLIILSVLLLTEHLTYLILMSSDTAVIFELPVGEPALQIIVSACGMMCETLNCVCGLLAEPPCGGSYLPAERTVMQLLCSAHNRAYCLVKPCGPDLGCTFCSGFDLLSCCLKAFAHLIGRSGFG